MPYPSINFSSTVATPSKAKVSWRDKIGIIAEFNKGPTDALEVNSTNYDYIYGNDSSVGNAIVQQAYAVGANNLTIARATPDNSPATYSFYFGSLNPYTFEPRIGYELASTTSYTPIINNSVYTIGTSLEFQYVGSPIVTKAIYDKVSTDPNTSVDHPNFTQVDAEVNFKFVVAGFAATGSYIQQADKDQSITVSAIAGDIGTKQVITVSKTDTAGTNDITSIYPEIRKGLALGTGTKGSSGSSDTIVQKFNILSEVFDVDSSNYGILVEVVGAAVTTGTISSIKVIDPSEDQYVIGYQVQTVIGDTFVPRTSTNSYFTLPGISYVDDTTNFPVDSYFRIPGKSNGLYLTFKYQTYVTPTSGTSLAYPLAVTEEELSVTSGKGIRYKFGETSTNPTLTRLIIGGSFLIPVGTSYLVAGSSSPTSTLAYTVGTPASQIVLDLYNAAAASPTYIDIMQDFNPQVAYFPYGFDLATQLTGQDADRVQVKFQIYSSNVAAAGDAIIQPKDIYTSINGAAFALPPSITSTAATGGTLATAPAFTNLVDAIGGPTFAQRDFYDIDGKPSVRVISLSPGTTNVKVSITPQSSLNANTFQFLLQVFSTNSTGVVTTENLILNTANLSPTITGLMTGSLDSNYVRAYFIPYLENSTSGVKASLLLKGPLRPTPGFSLYSANYAADDDAGNFGAAYMSKLPLLGGSDYVFGKTEFTPTQLRQKAFLAAVNRMADVNAAFIVLAGISYGDPTYAAVFDALVTQVKTRTAEVGISQLLLEGPPNALPRRLASLANSLDSGYISVIDGHITQQLPSGVNIKGVSTLGYYAGLAATRPPQISPHAPYTTSSLLQIVSSDTKGTPKYKEAISEARVDTLYFDNGLGIWKFLDGLTTSSKPNEGYFSVNRIRAQIISDVYSNLQWVRSLTNSTSLQNKVSSQVTAYMNTKQTEGWFLALGNVICNSTNNTSADIYAGRLNLQLSYVPVIPADFLFANLIEDYSLIVDLSLTTSATAT